MAPGPDIAESLDDLNVDPMQFPVQGKAGVMTPLSVSYHAGEKIVMLDDVSVNCELLRLLMRRSKLLKAVSNTLAARGWPHILSEAQRAYCYLNANRSSVVEIVDSRHGLQLGCRLIFSQEESQYCSDRTSSVMLTSCIGKTDFRWAKFAILLSSRQWNHAPAWRLHSSCTLSRKPGICRT